MNKDNVYHGIEDHFQAMLSSDQKKYIDKKRKILNTFLEIEDHCTVQDITDILEAQGVKISQELIQDTLESFCQYGIAKKRTFEGTEVHYEHLHPGSHHDHFICIQCGKIIDFVNRDLELIQSQIARLMNFYPLHHRMEMYGLCSDCYGARTPILPLNQASPGEILKIEQLLCGRNMANRLNSLGLTIGTVIEVIGNQGFGPVLVNVRGSRLGLGREMAQKIMVYPAKDGDSQKNPISAESVAEKKPTFQEGFNGSSIAENNLSELREGESGIIKRINGSGYFRHRLMEMGFTPGSSVYVEKFAPLKDPIEYIIKGYHISLRREEAVKIIIDKRQP